MLENKNVVAGGLLEGFFQDTKVQGDSLPDVPFEDVLLALLSAYGGNAGTLKEIYPQAQTGFQLISFQKPETLEANLFKGQLFRREEVISPGESTAELTRNALFQSYGIMTEGEDAQGVDKDTVKGKTYQDFGVRGLISSVEALIGNLEGFYESANANGSGRVVELERLITFIRESVIPLLSKLPEELPKGADLEVSKVLSYLESQITRVLESGDVSNIKNLEDKLQPVVAYLRELGLKLESKESVINKVSVKNLESGAILKGDSYIQDRQSHLGITTDKSPVPYKSRGTEVQRDRYGDVRFVQQDESITTNRATADSDVQLRRFTEFTALPNREPAEQVDGKKADKGTNTSGVDNHVKSVEPKPFEAYTDLGNGKRLQTEVRVVERGFGRIPTSQRPQDHSVPATVKTKGLPEGTNEIQKGEGFHRTEVRGDGLDLGSDVSPQSERGKTSFENSPIKNTNPNLKNVLREEGLRVNAEVQPFQTGRVNLFEINREESPEVQKLSTPVVPDKTQETKNVFLRLEDASVRMRFLSDKVLVDARFKEDTNIYVSFLESKKLYESLKSLGFNLDVLRVNGVDVSPRARSFPKREERYRDFLNDEEKAPKETSSNPYTSSGFSLLL